MLKYGLIPEFVGRLPVVATLEDLDEPSLKRILTEPKNALVKQYQRMFEMETVDLTLADEALSAIARKAIDRKTGARGLRSIMESILLDTMFDLPSLEGVEEVVISREVVEGAPGRSISTPTGRIALATPAERAPEWCRNTAFAISDVAQRHRADAPATVQFVCEIPAFLTRSALQRHL